MAYWYPFPFLLEARPADSYVTLTGLTYAESYGGAAGAPIPDFPIIIKELDQTQIFNFDVPGLEKRISTVHALPRAFSLSYVAVMDQGLYHIRQFYRNQKGRFSQFNFIDPEKWTFDPALQARNFNISPLLETESDYVIKVRFDNNFEAKRESKNFYWFDVQLIEVFT